MTFNSLNISLNSKIGSEVFEKVSVGYTSLNTVSKYPREYHLDIFLILGQSEYSRESRKYPTNTFLDARSNLKIFELFYRKQLWDTSSNTF